MRRIVRPSTRNLIVFVALVVALIVWVCGELGRSLWFRSMVALTSGLVFVFFALGWSAR